jgi:hypothetical protein
MAVNPFLRGAIRKKIDAKSFKGGMKERKELSDSAGVRGFSKWEMDRKLKEAGYDMKKRKGIMGQILKKKPEKINEKTKERNLKLNRIESRMASDAKTARVAGHGSFGGGKVATQSRVALGGEAGSLSGSSFASQGRTAGPPLSTAGGTGPKRFL